MLCYFPMRSLMLKKGQEDFKRVENKKRSLPLPGKKRASVTKRGRKKGLYCNPSAYNIALFFRPLLPSSFKIEDFKSIE